MQKKLDYSCTSHSSEVDVAVVIVSWNTRDLLIDCLVSLEREFARLPQIKSEVWVVDNGSTDGTLAVLREHFAWVKRIENDTNVGFAAANNQAIARSQSRYALLLNPDTVVHPRAVEALLSYMDAHPRAGAAGSHLLNPDGSAQASCFPAPTLVRELWRLLHMDRVRALGCYDTSSWPRSEPRSVDVVQGTSMMLRRTALQEVGALDEAFFIYSEEVDLCLRLRRASWSVVWVPQSQVVHYGGQSTRQVASKMFLNLYRYKVLYFRKNHGRRAAWLYKCLLLLASLLRLLGTPLGWMQRAEQRQHYRSITGNYWRLVRTLPSL